MAVGAGHTSFVGEGGGQPMHHRSQLTSATAVPLPLPFGRLPIVHEGAGHPPHSQLFGPLRVVCTSSNSNLGRQPLGRPKRAQTVPMGPAQAIALGMTACTGL